MDNRKTFSSFRLPQGRKQNGDVPVKCFALNTVRNIRSTCIFYCMVSALIWLMLIPPAYASRRDELNNLRNMWKSERYSEVLPLLISYREKPYGKNAEIDYMIVTSECRMQKFQGSSDIIEYFKWILSNYSLDERSRNLVEIEMRQCSSLRLPQNIAFASTQTTASAGVRGKSFYWLGQNNAVSNTPVKVIREIPAAEFDNRLFETTPEGIERGRESVKKLGGTKYKVESSEHFIVASSSGHTALAMQNIAQNLEKVLRFYARQYKMLIPSSLVTVYLTPNTWELGKLAETIHGIKVSGADIGYSFQDDLSVVGVLQANSTYVGTLAHELFHLMVRNDFGDIPPWMDEGMASLYEVLEIKGENVKGLPNWRGDVLERFRGLRPAIGKLVGMDWRAFENAERDYEAVQQTTNNATARYFVLYLQENQKLVNIYDAFHKRNVASIKTDPAEDSVLLLESVLKKPVSEVDKDFSDWFQQLSRKIQDARVNKKGKK